MRYLSLLLLLFFGAPLAVQAAPPTPEFFIQKVGEWIEEGNLAKIAMGVRFNREVGEVAFKKMMAKHATSPTEASEKWLNTVARAYRLEGFDQLNQQLSAAHLLWPLTRWKGTMFEADGVTGDTHGTVARNVPAQPSGAGGARDHFKEGVATAQQAVRLGNDQALALILPALQAHLKKNPGHLLSDEVLALEVSSLESTGLWSEALERGKALASRVKGQPALTLHLAMLSAARKLERPSEVDRLLQATRKLIGEADEPLGNFILDSIAFERRCQQKDVPLQELTQRHVEVWRQLKGERLERIPGGLGRQLVEAAGIWVHESLKRMQRESDEFPDRAQLYYIVWEDLKRLRELSRTQMPLEFQPTDPLTVFKLWNPEFMIGTHALELEVVGAFRKAGDEARARQMLAALKAPVQLTYEKIDTAGKSYQMAYYGRPIKLEGGFFEFAWTVGEVNRMVSMERMERARLDQDARALEDALFFQKTTRTQGGFLGLEDARFLKVERLIGSPNPAAAAGLNSELEKLSVDNKYRPGKIACLVNGAEIDQKTGKTESSIKKASEAVKLIEEYLTEVGGRGAERERFRRAYELLAELQLKAGKNEEAFATLARLGQAESMMTTDVDRLASNDPKLKAAVEGLARTRARGQALEQAKGNQAAAGRKTDQVEGEIASNRAEFYKALGDIRRKHPGYGQMLAVRPVNFARMQQYVPDNTAVVQIFPAKEALFLFVLTREELKIQKVAVTQKELTKLAKQARRGLLRSRDRGLNRAGRAIRRQENPSGGAEGSLKAFGELHKYLIDPISKDIESAEVLAIIPSGALMNVPLQALSRKKGESVEFLIERKQVVTLLKSSDLEGLSRKLTKPKGGTLVVGNPDGTLPGATLEAKSIAKLFPKSKVLIEDEATLDRVQDLGGMSFLHLATHGILDRKDPNLSYLVLGKGDKLDIGGIAALDLSRVRMVTLSACETALGVNADQQSELTTLADAFSFAGCPTVTASLWKVSDDSTKLLMEKYYERLEKGATPASAMQTAQKFLISQKTTQHPYHWAPFLLIGDWR